MTETPITPAKLPPLPALAKTPAIRRFAAGLIAHGHLQASAEAIAVAVTDPASARRQLDQPGELRVDGGVLRTIQTSVWLPAVVPYPTNPRVLPAFAYPAEGRVDRRAPLRNLESDPSGAPELLLPPMTPAELTGTLDAQIEYLRRQNNLSESVGNLGIREPLLLVALSVSDSSDAARHSVMAAVDGSSRVTAGYEHLGLDPAEVVFRLGRNERQLRQRIADVLALLQRPSSALSDEDRAALRVLAVPATIIVGFESDDGKSTLAEAIASRLGILHVDPPRPWSPGSRYDVQLDVALRAILDAERITRPEFEWLSGLLDPELTQAAAFSEHPDVRAAGLFQALGRRDNLSSRAIRGLTAQTQVSAEQRSAIVAEGALRTFRSTVGDTAAHAARVLLAAIYRMPELQKAWTVDIYSLNRPTRGEALASALSELEVLGGPGPEIRRALALAAYWLARYRVVPRQTRGGQSDRRDITSVLAAMMTTEHGIRQFFQIIGDGRGGTQPRQVDETGVLQKAADGTYLTVDDTFLRTQWPAADASKPPDEQKKTLSPEAELEVRMRELSERVDDLSRAVTRLDGPRLGGDGSLVQSLGLPKTYADPLIMQIVDAQGRLAELKRIANSREGSAESTGESEAI